MEELTYFLYPSKLFVSKLPAEVTTVLGSCISVCIHDPVSKIGGICHFMLPVWKGEGLASPKYGDIAIQVLIEKLTALGAPHESLTAKIVGGADKNPEENVFKVGRKNFELAFSYLERLNISIVGHHVGGERPRKLIFNTATGKVLVKLLSKDNF